MATSGSPEGGGYDSEPGESVLLPEATFSFGFWHTFVSLFVWSTPSTWWFQMEGLLVDLLLEGGDTPSTQSTFLRGPWCGLGEVPGNG